MQTPLFVIACLLCLLAGAGACWLWTEKGAAAMRLLAVRRALQKHLGERAAQGLVVRPAFRVTAREANLVHTILVEETGEPPKLLARRAVVCLDEARTAPRQRAPTRPPPTPRVPVVRLGDPRDDWLNVYTRSKGPPS